MRVFFAAIFLCLLSLSAEARPTPYGTTQFSGDRYIARQGVSQGAPARHVARGKAHKARYYYRVKKRHPASPLTLARATGDRELTAVLGGRPSGCPFRFCGCGASLHLFGRIIPSLNLAANWLRFPRAAPAPDMAAARRGHVFVLKRHLAGNTWLVHDSNSGRGRTRVHPRSIAGYTIVNPRGGRV